MGAVDKMQNKSQQLQGQAKRKVGEVTDNEQWQAEGKKDEVAGNLKQAGEKVKDAFR